MINLAGQIFGRLLVLETFQSGGAGWGVVWDCRCDCGNIVKVRSSALKNGNVQSCGCISNKNLVGEVFGRLTVINLSSKTNSRKARIWECLCSCGNEVFVTTDCLTSGNTRSCGCGRRSETYKTIRDENGEIWVLGEDDLTKEKRDNLVGTRFGRLLVTEFAYAGKSRELYWKCVCDCGETTITAAGNLRRGTSQSCGCLRLELKQKPFGTASFNAIIGQYKNRALKKNLPFELTEEEFRELILKNCVYCGKEPSNLVKHEKDFMIYNGIDRVDSSKGYTVSNSVSCCGVCNLMKRSMSCEDFLNHVRRINSYNEEN
jgi:hypothetical protein